MQLHFDNQIWIQRQPPRGKVAVADCREHAPLSRHYHKVTIPPLDAMLMNPGAMWLVECREEGDWNTPGGMFRLLPHLVEIGLVAQPLPWMPGMCLLLVNLGGLACQIWGGAHFGDFKIAEGYGDD